jgi:hypothetical protein
VFCLELRRKAAYERKLYLSDPKIDPEIPDLILENRATGERHVASVASLQAVLAELGLEIVPAGTVDWGEHPDSAYMEAQIERLTSAIRALSKKPIR